MPQNLPLNINLFSYQNLAYRIKFPIEPINAFLLKKTEIVNVYTLKQHKADGSIKERTIHNPNNVYKSVLRKVNKFILNRAILPDGICGAIKGKTLLDMVKFHCGKEAIYKIDLKSFYPNISFKRIFALLLKLNCSKEIAMFLAKLTTFKDYLPEGFPTSPMIANIIAFKLDKEQLSIAKKYNLYRSRWIDDIVFSGRIKDLEKAVPLINTSVFKNGFILHPKKKEFMRRFDKPTVTGLIVDKNKPYIPVTMINIIKDILIFGKEYGVSKLQSVYYAELGEKNPRLSLMGKIAWVSKYNPKDAEDLNDIFKEIKW